MLAFEAINGAIRGAYVLVLTLVWFLRLDSASHHSTKGPPVAHIPL